MEIERKFKVEKLPNLQNVKKAKIIQAYLNTDSEPTLRIRKYNDEYLLTYKYSKKDNEINVCNEVELPITEECFNNLLTKIEGNIIEKTRYFINEIELDIFEGKYEGLILAEVEFESIEDANRYNKPNWLGEDVTKDKNYRNSYLAKKH
ncbi:MAG: CYTH domain-containing protein [Bacilli bacterium]|jgi:CYTH domain-containing protein|nr:CYTH domain-containing protein [Bacilli bacterium]